MTKPVHLWWLWSDHQKDGKSAAAALKETERAYSLCGQKDLPHDQVTVFLDDATCEACKFRARQAA